MLKVHQARKSANRSGPGLITAAADDDPSGLAIHSQAGAQSGVRLLRTPAFTTPPMISIQMIRSRMGWLTLTLLAYVAVVFMLHVGWERVMVDTAIVAG